MGKPRGGGRSGAGVVSGAALGADAKPQRRRYTPRERTRALAMVAGEGGLEAVSHVARRLGIPDRTLRDWVAAHREDFLAAARAAEMQLAPLAFEAREKALHRVIDQLDEAKGKDAAIIFGILDDKLGGWSERAHAAGVHIRLAVSRDILAVEVKE